MKPAFLTACAAALIAAAAPATAGVLYATNNFDLYTLNQANGSANLVGTINSNTSGRNVIDMAAAGSTLYGLVLEQVGGVTQSRLSLIDAAAATMTDLPLISGIVTTAGPARRIDTIAFHAGTMYGINNGPNRSLYTINTSTGAATLVAALPSVSNGLVQYRSLSFGAAGVLYAALNNLGDNTVASELVTIDIASGAQTTVGSLAGAVLGDLAYDGDSGILFGGGFETTALPDDQPTVAALFAIDASAGQASLRGGFPAGLWAGLAVLPSASVPEPGTLLLVGLAIVGLLTWQKRRSLAG